MSRSHFTESTHTRARTHHARTHAHARTSTHLFSIVCSSVFRHVSRALFRILESKYHTADLPAKGESRPPTVNSPGAAPLGGVAPAPWPARQLVANVLDWTGQGTGLGLTGCNAGDLSSVGDSFFPFFPFFSLFFPFYFLLFLGNGLRPSKARPNDSVSFSDNGDAW
jgi:hypothetical protein